MSRLLLLLLMVSPLWGETDREKEQANTILRLEEQVATMYKNVTATQKELDRLKAQLSQRTVALEGVHTKLDDAVVVAAKHDTKQATDTILAQNGIDESIRQSAANETLITAFRTEFLRFTRQLEILYLVILCGLLIVNILSFFAVQRIVHRCHS